MMETNVDEDASATGDTDESLEDDSLSKKTDSEEGQPVLKEYQARYDGIFWITIALAFYASIPTAFSGFLKIYYDTNNATYLNYNRSEEIECNDNVTSSSMFCSLQSFRDNLTMNMYLAIFAAVYLAIVLVIIKYLPEIIFCSIVLIKTAASIVLVHEFIMNTIYHKDYLDRGEALIGLTFARRGYFLYFMLFFVNKFGVTSIVQYFQCFSAKRHVFRVMFSDPLCIPVIIICVYNMSFWKVTRLTVYSTSVNVYYSYFTLFYSLLILNFIVNFGNALFAKLIGFYYLITHREAKKLRPVVFTYLEKAFSCNLKFVLLNTIGVLPFFQTLVLALRSRFDIEPNKKRDMFTNLIYKIYVIFNAPMYSYALASAKGYSYNKAKKRSIELLKKNSSSLLAVTQGLDAMLQFGVSIYILTTIAVPTHKYGFNNLPPPECLNINDFKLPLAVDVITFFTLYFYINIGMVASNTVYATVACRFEDGDSNDSVGKTIFEGVMKRKCLANIDSSDI